MPARSGFTYAVVRVVPRVEREEFVNAGVILFAPTRAFLGCAVRLDEARLRALDPAVDLGAVQRHLAAFRAVCAGEPNGGPIAALPASERFHWLVAPRSALLQTSPVHTGLCDDPAQALDRLFATLVLGA